MGTSSETASYMKIAILNVQVPFVKGGAEYLAESLCTQLVNRNHEVEIVKIPEQGIPTQALKGMIAARCVRLDQTHIDMVIALKFPAYAVPFENKKLWLLHQRREAYDLWGTSYSGYPMTVQGQGLRNALARADSYYLREAKSIYTISSVVAERLRKNNNISANDVLYPPLDRPDQFYQGDFGNYFFYPSRIAKIKRQTLAVEAMRYVKSDFTLVLAGKPDRDKDLALVYDSIRQHKLQEKVRVLGYVSNDEKVALAANCCAFVYVPLDEDYGYVTLEAFSSGKPVITTRDAGGPCELINHEHNGLISEPTPEALAECMERMWTYIRQTRVMGQAAFDTIETRNLNWDYVIERLIS
jgi:glycosyltransferase involved in cell wall biosynthesis